MPKLKTIKKLALVPSIILFSIIKGYGQCPDSVDYKKTGNAYKITFYPKSNYKNTSVDITDGSTTKTINTNGSSKANNVNINNIGDWSVVGCNNALPVELMFFRTQINGSQLMLEWATASEINNSHFIVQRLYNNKWKNINRVKGNGTSHVNHYYNAEINKKHGTSYYRLKQVDFDGSYEYSDIKAVKIVEDKKKKKLVKIITPRFTIEINNGKKKVRNW